MSDGSMDKIKKRVDRLEKIVNQSGLNINDETSSRSPSKQTLKKS